MLRNTEKVVLMERKSCEMPPSGGAGDQSVKSLLAQCNSCYLDSAWKLRLAPCCETMIYMKEEKMKNKKKRKKKKKMNVYCTELASFNLQKTASRIICICIIHANEEKLERLFSDHC